jgi:DNA polymerase III delta prime subunit
MKLTDIKADISFEIWVRPEFEGDSLETGVGFISFSDYAGHVYNFRVGGNQSKIVLRDSSSAIDLNFHLKRGCACLAEILQVANDGSALLKILFFYGDIIELGDIEIGIDERIEKTAKKNGIRFNKPNDLGRVLAEKCKITVGGEDFFLLMRGPATNADFEIEKKTEDDDASTNEVIVGEKYRAFSICGERVRIPVERRSIDKTRNIFFATKVIFTDNQKSEGALCLARGSVGFSDYTKTGGIRALAAGAMNLLSKEAGSYLKQWDEYGAVEGEMLLSRAKAVGKIVFHTPERTAKGVKLFVSQPPEGVSEGDVLEITSEEPLYIRRPEITWEEYSKVLSEEFKSKKEKRGKEKERDDRQGSLFEPAPILSMSKTSIELELQAIPDDGMFLILSINGDKIQIERRMRARAAILEGRSANPLLGLIIEEGGVLPDIQRVTKLKPLTPFVKDKVFKYSPTDRQVEAVSVALNTPDIALIQGPPGTGKTTVITAILERLNEEYNKTKSIRGQILVSGFQHDAVENIVSRLSINALPAVKFGKRSSESEFSGDVTTEKINQWCSDVAGKIRQKNPEIAQTEDQLRLSELFCAYATCPSKNNTIDLVKRILALPRSVISEEVENEAKCIMDSLQTELCPSGPSMLRLARSLRVTTVGFEDDGPARAIDLLEKLEDRLSIFDKAVLERAGRWQKGNPIDFLTELKALKGRLLSIHTPSPEFRVEKTREDVLKLSATVSKILDSSLQSANKKTAVLADFLHELEDNPGGVREAVGDYNFVFAATVQQSEGREIRSAKTKSDEDVVKYDTVIIDEAARASPRDLLIPMSQAEKRIILVGDHRQLPHLIDEEVAKVLEGDSSAGSKKEIDFVKKSMFEYLFRRLKKLEEKDGIKRTVTLDAQYRSHPLLGDFVSDNFYKRYGEDYRSPLPESFFEHSLESIEGSPAVWIDVPNSQGKEEVLPSHSRRRIAEAQSIAKQLSEWINSTQAIGLSFGVISFYKAQVFAVFEALAKYGISERAQDGAWQISPQYRFLDGSQERLRIGTVDAFQGMEFDVVFLSVVRSQNANSRKSKEKEHDMRLRKLFGHLMSENRLCVSMSRQKKALVVVGDAEFVNTQDAFDAVPALKNFYDLCKSRGVVM